MSANDRGRAVLALSHAIIKSMILYKSTISLRL